MNNFEGKVKKLLVDKKMSIELLAAQIDMSKNNLIDRFKKGSIETKHLEKIAEVLGVPISYFFEDGNSSATKYVDSGNKYIDELIETQNKLIKSLETRVMEYENRLNNNNLQTA